MRFCQIDSLAWALKGRHEAEVLWLLNAGKPAREDLVSRGSCCSYFGNTKFSVAASFPLKIPWWFLFSTESWPIYSPPLAEVMGSSQRPGVGLIWVCPMDHRAVITGFVRTSERSGVPSLTTVNPAQPQQPTLDGVLLATCREPLKTTGRSPLLWQKPLMLSLSTKAPLLCIWLKMWYYHHFMPSREEKY